PHLQGRVARARESCGRELEIARASFGSSALARIDGKATVQLSGCNVGREWRRETASANGEGNVVIGYEENPRARFPLRSAAGAQNASHKFGQRRCGQPRRTAR